MWKSRRPFPSQLVGIHQTEVAEGHRFRISTAAAFPSGLPFLGFALLTGDVRFDCLGFTYGGTGQFDPVRVMNQAVENAVGNRGIADLIMPVRDRHLASQYRGANPVTVVADLQKVSAFGVGQGSHQPIVDNQNVDASESIQQLWKAAVDAGDREVA